MAHEDIERFFFEFKLLNDRELDSRDLVELDDHTYLLELGILDFGEQRSTVLPSTLSNRISAIKIDRVGYQIFGTPLLPENLHEQKGLRELHLERLGLGFPPQLCKLKHLQKLWISADELWQIPPCIDQLAQLRDLGLICRAGDQFLQLPLAIRDLPLEKLLISDVMLDEKVLSLIFRIGGLKTLVLRANALDRLPRGIGQLDKLEVLNLSLNPSLHQLPPDLALLENLKMLDLSQSPHYITSKHYELRDKALSIPEVRIELAVEPGQMPNLEVLHLKGRHLQRIPDFVFRLEGLKRLDLRYNYIGTLDQRLLDLPHLENLVISHNDIKAIPDEFAHLVGN